MSAGNKIGQVTRHNGPAFEVTRTLTTSADMTTAAAISAAVAADENLVADEVVISSDTAMSFILQEETSATALVKVFVPVNGTVVLSLRSGIKVPTVAKRLFGKASGAGNVAIYVSQHSEK
jgi:hypothetical protein